MKDTVLFAYILLFSLQVSADHLNLKSGTLTYQETQNNERLLVYSSEKGETLKIFDYGLEFHYETDDSHFHTSPDKLYVMIPFSESGTLLDVETAHESPVTLNLCAFVRLNDGCITSVATDSQCGGDWAEGHIWSSSLHENNEHLFENKTKVQDIYKNYVSRASDATRRSSPRVLSYLLEGTAFDNLLTCDPPTPKNQKTYTKLRELLKSEGDIESAKKIDSRLDLLSET